MRTSREIIPKEVRNTIILDFLADVASILGLIFAIWIYWKQTRDKK